MRFPNALGCGQKFIFLASLSLTGGQGIASTLEFTGSSNCMDDPSPPPHRDVPVQLWVCMDAEDSAERSTSKSVSTSSAAGCGTVDEMDIGQCTPMEDKGGEDWPKQCVAKHKERTLSNNFIFIQVM